MWCYQKPGFEALLLAELQRQQQCSQFCDTLLKAEGVSVPAHSCVLSAISPHVSSALSSTAAPPAGQSHLLEFRALGACTLLHMVRLLYSGEMAGEGEKEKQEAISAAAKLGIHGLVEVKKSDHKSRNEGGGGQLTEVGVQTEPLMLEQNEGRQGKWRREVRDGSTFLWKDTISDVEKDMWTQTEELQVNTAPPTHSAASFETTDLTALQGLGQTDSHFIPPQIPYVPISLVYPPEQNQTPQPSSFPAAFMQDTTTAGHTSVTVLAPPYTPVLPSLPPFSTQTALCDADPHSWWTGPQGAARDVVEGEEWEGKQFEQFQGNIPGFINYFLNADKEEGPCRGRPRQRRGAAVGDARRAGTGERRARRPRARTAGRGRGGLMQTVDVQDVGVSRLQKLFLQRWGMRTSRTGQGGGAAGRKLYLRAREHLKPTRRYQRRGRCGKEWEFSQSGDMLPYSVGGGGDTQCGGRSTTQQFKQDSLPVGRAQRARAKSAASVSFPFPPPPMRFYNIHTLSSPSPSLQPSPSPIMLSTAAPYVSPATSLLHTTTLPPPAPPPHQDQPEQIDRLLEEVMMGLDILPNNNNSTPHSQPRLPASSSSCTYASSGKNLTQSKQGCTTALLEAGPGVQGSTQVVAVGASSSTSGEVPDLQQQGEGELNDMLNHFLQSFERHINSCSAREEEAKDGETPTEAIKSNTVRNNYKKNKIRTVAADSTRPQNTLVPRPVMRSQTAELQQSDEAETRPNRSQPSKASARTPKHADGEPTKRQSKRRKSQYLFSLERKRVKTPISTSDAKIKILHDREDKQLKRMPVVKLERRVPLPVRVKLQEHSCQSLEVMDPAKVKTSSSSVKYPGGTLSQKNQPVLWSTKTYPIRSRFREAHIVDTLPFLEGQLAEKRPPSAGQPRSRPGRPKKNGQLLSLSNGGSSTPTIQLQTVEHCGTNGQLEKNQEIHEEELNVQPQEEAQGPTRRGKKRGESGEETSDDATVAKRVCCEQMAQPTSETCIPSSKSAGFASEQAIVEADDMIDVETVSLTSEGDFLQIKEQEDKSTVWREIILRETGESLMDEETEGSLDIIDVDGDTNERTDQEKHTDDCRGQTERDRCQSRTAPTLSYFVSPPPNPTKEISERSRGSWEDEDIDVIGGSSPVPDPEVISWAESSEGEEGEGDEDVDVVGEKTGYASSVVFATMIKGELVNQKYKTVVL